MSECDLSQMLSKRTRKLSAQGTQGRVLAGVWQEGWAWCGFLGAELSDLGVILAMAGGLPAHSFPSSLSRNGRGMA